MLNIKVDFDQEDGRDAIDPLGDLTMSDGASTIVASTVYLDSFLAALISAYNQSSTATHVAVEISEESHLLLIDTTPAGWLSISYENHKLAPQPRQDLKAALLVAARYLLSSLASLPDSKRNSFMNPIREFVAVQSNGDIKHD
jgi:hypothetical protein